MSVFMRSGLWPRSAAAAAVALVVWPAAAHGDPGWTPVDKRPCFSRSELVGMDRHEGWTRARLERWTETRGDGAQLGAEGDGYYGVQYLGCVAGRYVTVVYRVSDDTWAAAALSPGLV